MAQKVRAAGGGIVFEWGGEMKHLICLAILITGGVASAGDQSSAPLTLQAYLEQVKSGNSQVRAVVESITSYEHRLDEPDLALSPEFYAQFLRLDDKKPTAQPTMMGTETNVTRWRAGLRKQTDFGLGLDLYFNSQRTKVENASPMFLPIPNYMESSAALQLTQSLWRNGFGESTRNQVAAGKAAAEASLYESRYQLKAALLQAQNVYWALVSYNQIVKLQQDNVERAKRLNDYMVGKTKMKLFDDTDAMQTQASLEMRELELQQSLDERASLMRQFNSLRGVNDDDVPQLEELPTREMMIAVEKIPSGKMAREDYEQLRAQARAALAKAKADRSKLQPQLDLVAQIATNGRDGLTQDSYYQATTDRFPMWSIGVNFSVALDFFTVRDVKRGYKEAQSAAENLARNADFNETRMWNDVVKKKKEAQGRFERATNLEKLQTELVKRYRQRLLNGRTTTFEAIKIEDGLAGAQIQRVRSQLDLLQVHNVIKTFEAKQ